VLSHELRTPVTVIAGFNRLLLAEEVGPLNDEQRHFLEEAGKSCRRLDAFIANLLEVGRRAATGLTERCAMSLEATASTVLSFLKPVLDERRIRVSTHLAPDADRVFCDPMRIEQVLINLIGNAAKYAPAGGQVELASRLVEGAPRPRVEVVVADDGPGVAPEHRERIFERYFRAGSDLGAGGLGLGLAICRDIVEAHGGRIQVGDRPGGGSRFSFTLPVQLPDQVPAPPLTPAPGSEGAR